MADTEHMPCAVFLFPGEHGPVGMTVGPSYHLTAWCVRPNDPQYFEAILAQRAVNDDG